MNLQSKGRLTGLSWKQVQLRPLSSVKTNCKKVQFKILSPLTSLLKNLVRRSVKKSLRRLRQKSLRRLRKRSLRVRGKARWEGWWAHHRINSHAVKSLATFKSRKKEECKVKTKEYQNWCYFGIWNELAIEKRTISGCKARDSSWQIGRGTHQCSRQIEW